MRHKRDDEESADLTPASWLKFGQLNVLYIGFVALLVPLGLALDGPRPAGTQSLGGLAFALMLNTMLGRPVVPVWAYPYRK